MKWSKEALDKIEANRRSLEERLESAEDDEKNMVLLLIARGCVNKIADSKQPGEGFMLWEAEELFHDNYGECPRVGRHGSLTHQPECRWPVHLAGSIISKKEYRVIGHGKSPSNNNPFTSIWEKR
jgi:hypothetical protein